MNNGRTTPTVLVVDDEELIREGISRCLAGKADVVAVANADEAIAALGKGNFDLCLLDVFLPGMNGLDAMRKIKEMSPATKIVIMTGSYLTEDMRKRIADEAYTFIEKPFAASRIREVANGVLEPVDLQYDRSSPVNGIMKM